MEWELCSRKMPKALETCDVTIEYKPDGSRYVRVMWWSEKNQKWYPESPEFSWAIDEKKDPDLRVIAWKKRTEPYRGSVE